MGTDERRSYITFLYADGGIQWTTGDASGGSGGFGGTPAQAGFNAGDRIRFFNVPGSRTPEIINIASTSNVGRPGVWIFRMDEEIIITAGCSEDTSSGMSTYDIYVMYRNDFQQTNCEKNGKIWYLYIN